MARGLTDAQIVERIERLERNLARVAEQAGVEIEAPGADVDRDIVEIARAGETMRAAKLYHERTGVDFVEAQRVVKDL
jgi:hypothetical protein